MAVQCCTSPNLLLKLQEERSIASKWSSYDDNRKARFHRPTRDGGALERVSHRLKVLQMFVRGVLHDANRYTSEPAIPRSVDIRLAARRVGVEQLSWTQTSPGWKGDLVSRSATIL